MAEDKIKANFAIIREFVINQAQVEKLPKDVQKTIKACLNLGEQLLLDIHTIAKNGSGSP